MENSFREALSGFGRELLDGARERAKEHVNDAEFQERVTGIEKATMSMIEANVEKAVIIKMLQKHWDLRLSEAEKFVEWAINEV